MSQQEQDRLERLRNYYDNRTEAPDSQEGVWEDDTQADPMITTSLRLPRSVMTALRHAAADLGTRPTSLIRIWVEERLRRNPHGGAESTWYAVGADIRARRDFSTRDFVCLVSAEPVALTEQAFPLVVLRMQTVPLDVAMSGPLPGDEGRETSWIAMPVSEARHLALRLLQGSEYTEDAMRRADTGDTTAESPLSAAGSSQR